MASLIYLYAIVPGTDQLAAGLEQARGVDDAILEVLADDDLACMLPQRHT